MTREQPRGNPYLRALVSVAPLLALGSILAGLMLAGTVEPWKVAGLVAIGTTAIVAVVAVVSSPWSR